MRHVLVVTPILLAVFTSALVVDAYRLSMTPAILFGILIGVVGGFISAEIASRLGLW